MADEIIKNHSPEPAFVTWNSESEKHQALGSFSESVDYYDGIQKAQAFGYRNFLDIEPNRSVRPEFGRQDYNRFRASEATPKRQKDIIKMCMDAYDRVGIIRNVIDLMGDFSSQGITLVHPNKNIEKFYKKWFSKVNGKARSERFLNTLYRCGNVIVKRRTAKLSARKEQEMRKTAAAPDMKIEDIKVQSRVIPWQYDILNPLSVEVIGDDYLSTFVGQPRFALRVSKMVRNMVNDKVGNNKYLLSALPKDISQRLKNGDQLIPLDEEKVSAYYYKKDDWMLWSNPMIYAILDDIMMLEKMKLADIAALDGAISNIRLWKLGSLEEKILPTKAAINKLRNILASNVGGGTMDLVWGPELDFKESSTQVFRFLGEEKYKPVLNNIYAGLGIPPTLTGLASNGGGFTNNFISLKTLVERLEYGRDVLTEFWNSEIEIVQKAMGFRFPAKIHFDQMILSDEAAEKTLLIQLADRNIVSDETIVERFGELPEIEKIRVKREARSRNMETLPSKASPYHNPQHREDLEKIALGKDTVAPHDLGIIPADEAGDHPLTMPADRPKYDKAEEERKLKEERDFQMQQKQKPVGRPEDGRPRNSKDQQKRKQKEVKPRTSADLVNIILWANDAQKKIADLITPALLSHYDKKNVRSLTKSQMDELEYIKLCVLCGMEPYMEVDPTVVKELLDDGTPITAEMTSACKNLKQDFVELNEKQPSIEEMRQIQSSAYAISMENK